MYCGSFDGHAEGLAAPGQVTVRDLDPEARYQVRAFASRTGTDGGNGRLTRYSVSGGAFQDLEVADNVNAVATFSDVAPDGDGDLVIDVAVSPEGSSRFCYLGVLELTRAP